MSGLADFATARLYSCGALSGVEISIVGFIFHSGICAKALAMVQLPFWPLDQVFNYTSVKLQYEEKCTRLSGQNYFAKSKTVSSILDMSLLIQTVSVYLSGQTKAIVDSHLMYCSPSRNKLGEMSFKCVFSLRIQTHFNHV